MVWPDSRARPGGPCRRCRRPRRRRSCSRDRPARPRPPSSRARRIRWPHAHPPGRSTARLWRGSTRCRAARARAARDRRGRASPAGHTGSPGTSRRTEYRAACLSATRAALELSRGASAPAPWRARRRPPIRHQPRRAPRMTRSTGQRSTTAVKASAAPRAATSSAGDTITRFGDARPACPREAIRKLGGRQLFAHHRSKQRSNHRLLQSENCHDIALLRYSARPMWSARR